MTDIYSPANGDILDELEQPVYIADVDTYEMLYMNKACMRLLNCRDYHGKMCYAATQGADRPCSFCTNAQLSRDKFYKWDHFNKKLGGAYQLQDKLISWQGHNARLEIVFDVSSRVEQVNELQTVLETERQLVRAIQTVNGPGAIGERLNAALKLCGEYFQADRAYIFRVDEDGGLSNTYEWCKTGVEPQIHLLQHLDLHYIDRWMPYFEKQETVVTPDIEKIKDSKPDEYRTLSMQGIRSILEAPLFSSGRFIGFVGVDNPAAAKMENSGDILLSLAFAVSNALVRANSESELRSFQKRYELAEESAELGVWEYHIQAHRITNTSHSLKRFGVPDTLENVPESILPLVLPEDRKRLLEMFRKLEEGEPRVTADIWMTWKPGLPPRCERTIYSVARDADGRPSVAYGVSINITEQKLEEEKFARTIQSLLTANPESLCTFRVNLTQNICQEGHGVSGFILRALQAGSVDKLVGNIAAMIPDRQERAAATAQLCREKLLEAFKAGRTVQYADYRHSAEDGGVLWVRTYARMLKNPQTEDVEGVIYSLNVTNEKRREAIFQLITDQEYDYTALLHLRTGQFEFLNLSSRLLPKYHEALGSREKLFDYEMIRRFAVSTFIAAEDRSLYLSNSEIPVITKNLDEKGRFEINVRGHYTGHPDEFMCRKIQHYYLNENRDVVLVVQADTTESFLQQRKETERMRDILNSISAGVSVMLMPDQDHLQFQYVNKQLYRLLGFSDADNDSVRTGNMSGLVKAYWDNAFAGIHADDLERVRKTFRDNFREPFFVVERFRTIGADGVYRWLEQEVKLRRTQPEGRVFYATFRDVTKEVRLQQELDEQRKKQLERTLLDTIGSLPACSVLYREENDGKLVPQRYSDEFCRLKGCTQENIRAFNGQDGFTPVHPDDRPALEEAVRISRGDNQMHSAVYRIYTRNCGYRWVSVNFTHFSLGGQNYLYAVYTDIDELKKQEQQLEEQYNSAQTFLDSVADSYIATLRANLSQNLVEAVKGADPLAPVAAQLRYEDAVGALLAQMPREQDRRECAEFFSRQALTTAYENDVRNLSKEYMYQSDEGVKWAHCVITLTKRPGSGDIVSFMAVSDVNEAKLLSTIMDQVVTRHFDYVCCINVNSGRITLFFANTGWPGGVAIQPGSDYEKVMGEYNIKSVIAPERERSVEFMSLTGVRRALEHSDRCAASFTCDEGEGLRVKRVEFSYLDRENGLLALVRTDITEAQRQQLEQEEKLRAALTAAQKANEAKSDFLSRMSHDIRTPLNGIIGMTYLAQEQENSPRTADCLVKIDTSSKFLLGLVNDVLDMSKAESGRMELRPEPYAAAPFFKYLDSVIAPLCEEKNIRFVVDAVPVSGFLPLLDPLRINQVFFNLLSNAVKFTPEGGTVTYRLREHLTDAGRMVLEGWVCDTGIGMSETFQQVLFEPFSQENRRDNSETRGTGLGLAIVKKSLDLMGCTISVKSKIGAGSVFYIKGEFDCVPAEQAAGAAPAAAASRCEAALAGRHVLLCEDHPLNQEIAKALLQEKGLVVSVAEDGREAVRLFGNSAPGFYDLILMDIRMPVMDGYEATQAIRALDRADAATVPIVAMTADAFADDVKKCLELGMNGHIAKPIDPELLFRKITAVLRPGK